MFATPETTQECAFPPERHILARNRVFLRILCQNPSRGLGCSEWKESPLKKPQEQAD